VRLAVYASTQSDHFLAETKIMNARRRYLSLLVLLPAVLLTGCFWNGLFPRLEEVNVTWRQDGPAKKIYLEAASNSFCYLTRVSGNFQGHEERVRVGIGVDPNTSTNDPTGRWYVEGASDSEGLSATAQCSWYSSFGFSNPERYLFDWVGANFHVEEVQVWNYCPPPSAGGEGAVPCEEWRTDWVVVYDSPRTVPLQPKPSACYLSGIGNRFRTGDSAYVTSDNSDPPAITVDRYATGIPVCLTYQTSSPDKFLTSTYLWQRGQVSPTTLIPANKGVCFLTAINGNLTVQTDFVEIVRPDPNSMDPYVLQGSSGADPLWAEARCLLYESSS
jgi:hypothetical protein